MSLVATNFIKQLDPLLLFDHCSYSYASHDMFVGAYLFFTKLRIR